VSAVLDATSPPARKRARAPRIDIDAAILKHMDEIKRASKLVNDARRAARNERRRKSRLMKKAATLTPEDLERIAVLKRCGLYNPTGELVMAATSSPHVATSSPSSVQTTANTAAHTQHRRAHRTVLMTEKTLKKNKEMSDLSSKTAEC